MCLSWDMRFTFTREKLRIFQTDFPYENAKCFNLAPISTYARWKISWRKKKFSPFYGWNKLNVMIRLKLRTIHGFCTRMKSNPIPLYGKKYLASLYITVRKHGYRKKCVLSFSTKTRRRRLFLENSGGFFIRMFVTNKISEDRITVSLFNRLVTCGSKFSNEAVFWIAVKYETRMIKKLWCSICSALQKSKSRSLGYALSINHFNRRPAMT